MSTYTVIGKGNDADGLVPHDVKHDSEIVLTDVSYTNALKYVADNIKVGDTYIEQVGTSAPYAIQTYDEFKAGLELSRKFDAGEP